jgi:hypothetical protein
MAETELQTSGTPHVRAPGVSPHRSAVLAVALISAALLMTELAFTRIFSVTMYYHFAFLAISIALFGLSASGIYVFVARRWLLRTAPEPLLAGHALAYSVVTIVALVALVRLRVGLNYSPENLRLMLATYCLATLPFFFGGAVLSIAISRYASRVNVVYAFDLAGAATGCLLLIPLLNWMGAPGAVIAAALLAAGAAVLFQPAGRRRTVGSIAAAIAVLVAPIQLLRPSTFDVRATKGHRDDRVLFSGWNSFSRVAVYDRGHGDWSLSPRYDGPRPETRFMDIDSAASTPIVRFTGRLDDVAYLRAELTSLAYHLKEAPPKASGGFRALVIGPGGGRDLLAALVFGAERIDGVEINPIIVDRVMRDRFREFSGGIYDHPRVRITIDDGRSFVRRSPDRYDIIQASLVDTWAATAAGAYTLSENSLYTTEAFVDYLDHLTDDGVLSITRWVFDGLRLVSLAQEACAQRQCDVASQLAIVQHDRVATFLFKRSPFTESETAALRRLAQELGFTVLYAPDDRDRASEAASTANPPRQWRTAPHDYARLILSPDREAFYRTYTQDIRPTSDDRPFFFHTTRLEHQFDLAFGRGGLFGNGLSALLTLMGISGALVALFIVGPLAVTGRGLLGSGWPRWLSYFGCLGAGFMLIEIPLLQRFVLLLGHPVHSLTVTLFSLLLGTGLGSFASRAIPPERVASRLRLTLLWVVAVAVLASALLSTIIVAVIDWPLSWRIALAVVMLVPAGAIMGVALPAGVRLLATRQETLVPWAWGMNGALSVLGSTTAVFVAMNWGFSVTFLAGAALYLAAALLVPANRAT